jgi:hypothetical protein
LERKEQSISKFQDSKELSIRIASAQRDAVLIMTTIGFPEEMTEGEIKTGIEKWRKYFFELSDINNTLTSLTKPF